MKKEKIKKIIVLVIILGIFIFAATQLIPIFKDISTTEGRVQLKQDIQGLGIKGAFIIIGLMFAQIFLPILPGEPVEILAGMCFGSWLGLLVIIIGVILSTLAIMLLVRKLGRSFLYTFVDKEKIEKLESHKIFQNKSRLEMIMFILFFIPGTPKDIFIYLGALLPINPIKFLIISTLARIPSIVSSTIAGNNIMNENWLNIVLVYGITFALTGVIIYFASRKDKDIKEIVKKKFK